MAYSRKQAKERAPAEHKSHEEHLREKHLMLDPLPRGQMNEMVMDSMHTTSWKFWAVFALLSVVVAYGLFYSWGRMIAEGLGIAGVNRPSFGHSAVYFTPNATLIRLHPGWTNDKARSFRHDLTLPRPLMDCALSTFTRVLRN